jgi:hypothetical protein
VLLISDKRWVPDDCVHGRKGRVQLVWRRELEKICNLERAVETLAAKKRGRGFNRIPMQIDAENLTT